MQFILLLQCPDQPGIVARVCSAIFRSGANIVDLRQHTTDASSGVFFSRIAFWLPDESAHMLEPLVRELQPLMQSLHGTMQLYDISKRLRAAVCVSRCGHCLAELLYMHSINELGADIRVVVSNYPEHEVLVRQYGVAFMYIPATKQDLREHEVLLAVKERSDFLILARYMQVFSPVFLSNYAKDIINIHHGLLPSFKGPAPYRQAWEAGVKVIGATAHFVTEKLDAGPIICQQVEHVSHDDSLQDLVRKGRHLEKRALAEAVRSYAQHRVMRLGEKTIVF